MESRSAINTLQTPDFDFATAATQVQRKVMRKKKQIFPGKMPGLLLSSKADDTLKGAETIERGTKIFGKKVSILEFVHNLHDVSLSDTKELDDDALNVIRNWIEHHAHQVEC
mmetsp:Transcript_2019/g.2844  ORF Transcript_2019/g.2844 Transcript_2019/m.2844 type:complete len:112 (-) Transcript_2019:2181-2516(-)